MLRLIIRHSLEEVQTHLVVYTLPQQVKPTVIEKQGCILATGIKLHYTITLTY